MEFRWRLPICIAPPFSVHAEENHGDEEKDVDQSEHQPSILKLDLCTKREATRESGQHSEWSMTDTPQVKNIDKKAMDFQPKDLRVTHA